jgi:hypothetical protein
MCLIKWFIENIKKYWMELILVALLNLVLLILSENIIINTSSFSLMNYFLLALPSFFPLITAGIGAFLISKKTSELKEILFIPILAIFLSALIYTLISVFPLFFIPESDWQSEIDLIYEYYGEKLDLNEFKLNSYFELIPGLIEFILSAIGSAFIGSCFGALIEKKLKKKKK